MQSHIQKLTLKQERAHNAIVYAAKIMADSICDVLVNPELLAQIKQEFDVAREKG